MKRRLWLMGCGMVLAVFVAYAPAFRAGFVWNDSDYVTAPALQSGDGLLKIWTQLGATEQYYPVLHSAFWLQHRIWGDAPLGYHLTTIAWHTLASVLLWLVLRRLAVPGAWLGAILFALHPVCVESVAWVAEQKNTLSLVFYLAAAVLYLRFERSRKPSDYAFASGLFLLALLSKSVTATLPAALLVAAWWRTGDLRWHRDVRALVPWLVAGAAFGLFTAWVEHSVVGARGAPFELGWLQRTLLAGRVIWFYLGKLIWPADLIFIYPRWSIDAASLTAWIYPAAALALIYGTWNARGRSRGPVVALLFFCGSLFPTMGFMNLYAFRFSYVADHWQYLPSIGPLALAGAGITLAARRAARPTRRFIWVGSGLLLLILGGLTWRQCGLYRDIETFYRLTLAQNPESWMGQNNLGLLLMETGRANEASDHLRHAVELQPRAAEPANNLGAALRQSGRLADSIPYFRRAIELRSAYPEAEFNLALALAESGRSEDAKRHYRQTLTLRPDHAEAHNNLGNLLLSERVLPEALIQFEAALTSRPDFADAEHNLAMTLIALDRPKEALDHLAKALRLNPRKQDSRWVLSVMLVTQAREKEAIPHLREFLRQQPDHADAHLLLGQVLWGLGERDEALRLRERGQALQKSMAPPVKP